MREFKVVPRYAPTIRAYQVNQGDEKWLIDFLNSHGSAFYALVNVAPLGIIIEKTDYRFKKPTVSANVWSYGTYVFSEDLKDNNISGASDDEPLTYISTDLFTSIFKEA